jgi:hypothetical protein
MLKIEGLDAIQEELSEAQSVLQSLDGKLGSVTFNPEDPGSIEAAIAAMTRMIDDAIGEHDSNSLIGPMGEEMKEKYREAIIEKAAEERLKGDGSE